MQFHKAGSRPTRRGPADHFTGAVLVDPVIETPAPARLGCARVTFEPGARTAWHTHPFGQTIYIIAGVGRVQIEGGPVREIKAGDVVYFGPNEKHWHGAGPETGMIHIAMQEGLDGKFVTWMEKVTDGDYLAKPSE